MGVVHGVRPGASEIGSLPVFEYGCATQPVHPALLKSHPLPNHPPYSVPSCTPLQDNRSGQDRAESVLLNDFDKAFVENGITDSLKSKTVVGSTTNTISCGDIIARDSSRRRHDMRLNPKDILERNEDRGQEQNNETSTALEPFPGSIMIQPTLPPEPRTGDSESDPLPAPEQQIRLLELDQEQDESQNQEWSYTPMAMVAEPGTKKISTAQGGFTSSSEIADSTCASLLAHSVESDQHKREADSCNAGRCQSPFTARHRGSDTGSMEPMVAVVVPALSPSHRKGSAVLKGKGSKCQSKQRPLRTRQQKAPRKSIRQTLESHGHCSPGIPTQLCNDGRVGSDTSGTSSPCGDSDEDYTAGSDDSDSLLPPHVDLSLSLSLGIGLRESLVIIERLSGSLARSVRSAAVTERSVSSTRAGSRQFTRSSPVVPGSSAGQTLGPRLLSPEDISSLVSAFAQKLLELRRDSWTGATDAMNDEVAGVVAERGGEDRRFGEPGIKRPRWTREDDARLKDLKMRGWHWWEIKQQFPGRTKSALQQRWSTQGKHRQ
ncbi:hypothetical protein PABG_02474 [Paracoccidioides brasiliensis Pb03]|nr:hypothetical protein PABG_02474 [Paracoccidioides brasiliensis Pb03]